MDEQMQTNDDSQPKTTNADQASNLDHSQADDSQQLQEYLAKFIQLIPDLKQKDREEKIGKIINSARSQAPGSQAQSLLQQIDNLQNLNISESISDLDILESVMAYIAELQKEVVDLSGSGSESNWGRSAGRPHECKIRSLVILMFFRRSIFILE